MNLELDHIFFFCDPSLPEAKPLLEAGFVLTDGRIHTGQGTANKCVLFEENYLELIYLTSDEEAASNPLQLQKRANWTITGASPFGICLRGALTEEEKKAFWEYRPPYRPESCILIHKYNESNPEFPLLFVMESKDTLSMRPISWSSDYKRFLSHRVDSKKITSVIMEGSSIDWPLQMKVESIQIQKNSLPSITIKTDGKASLKVAIGSIAKLIAGND